jgi:hypothetical protein
MNGPRADEFKSSLRRNGFPSAGQPSPLTGGYTPPRPRMPWQPLGSDMFTNHASSLIILSVFGVGNMFFYRKGRFFTMFHTIVHLPPFGFTLDREVRND